MVAAKRVGLGLLAVALAACGCVDPSLYHHPPAAPVGGIVTPPGRPAYPTPRPGDIRVPAPPAAMPAPSSNNVAITIDKIGTEVQTANEASLAFRYADENVVVQSPATKLARRNGIRIGVARGNWRAQLDAATRRVRRTSRESMFIVVLSGEQGQILMGSDVYVTRLGYWGPRGYKVLLERGFVGRALVVRPRILGNGMVEVELWPRFTARGRRGAIDVTELATKVVVRDGQSVVIGGLSGASDDVGTVLFGVGARTRSHTMTMVLTPKIGGMGIDWPGSRR